MSLRTTPRLTDQILAFLTEIGDMFDVPRSMRQVVYSLEREHWKLAKRRTAAQKRERKRIREALWRLERADLVTLFEQAKGMKKYRLTPKGWLKFAVQYSPRLRAEEKKNARSDLRRGSYVVIFDIPEKYRRFRDTFRQVLLNLGCTRLQKSIFMTMSLQVIQFVARIIANCDLEDRVKILLVKSIL